MLTLDHQLLQAKPCLEKNFYRLEAYRHHVFALSGVADEHGTFAARF
jgi:hypothetical protein